MAERTKSINQYPPNTHYFTPNTVNENHHKINGYFSDFSGEKIRINHYFTRSKEDWDSKKNRGRADSEIIRSDDEFYQLNRQCTVLDLQPTKIHGYQEMKRFL